MSLRIPLVAIAIMAAAAVTEPSHADDWVIGGQPQAPAQTPAQRRPVNFSIPPQSLQSALDAFSGVTGIQILYDARFATNRPSPGVTGTFSPDVALRKLLADTGFAAIEVFHNGYTLVLDPNATILANASPIKAPTLALDVLHVPAPIVRDHRLYAMTLQFAIRNALLRDRNIRSLVYTADLFIWISQNGAVERARINVLAGNPDLNGPIAEALRGVVIGQSPPVDLPQPVHVRLTQIEPQ